MNGFEEPRWYLYAETDAGQWWLDRDTEIVRCRDCEHSTPNATGCWHFASYGNWGDTESEAPATVEPDGFCKWGARKR